MLAVSSKANQHKSRRIAGANLEQNKSPKVARVVAPKNPYFVTSITKFMRYTLVSFLVLYFSVFIFIFLQCPYGTLGF